MKVPPTMRLTGIWVGLSVDPVLRDVTNEPCCRVRFADERCETLPVGTAEAVLPVSGDEPLVEVNHGLTRLAADVHGCVVRHKPHPGDELHELSATLLPIIRKMQRVDGMPLRDEEVGILDGRVGRYQ